MNLKSNIIIQRAQTIEFPSIGSSALGFITVAEQSNNVPFEIKRVYWTYYTPNEVQRGGHAHKELEQIIFAVSGIIEFSIEYQDGLKEQFILDKPNVGLFIPKHVWRDIKFSHAAVLLCLASEVYKESDYIREYNEFLNWQNA